MACWRNRVAAARSVAGGTRKPMAPLQQAGVDLSSPEPIRAAMACVGSLVDELERAFAA